MNPPEDRRPAGCLQAPSRHALLPPNDVRRGRVTKTLWPPRPGTVRLLERFGDALVCVRYREDPSGLRRYVTVELVVEAGRSARARRRSVERALFPLAVAPGDRDLRATIKQAGAQWHAGDRLWYLPAGTIRRLGLEDHICVMR